MKFDIFNDIRGSLISIDLLKLEFIPKRVFSVFSVPKNEIRGNHAHYNTKQLVICLEGEIIVGMDDGNCLKEIIISPGESVFIDNLVWDYQKFLTDNSHILVICSTTYNQNDYINDKDEFYKIINDNN